MSGTDDIRAEYNRLGKLPDVAHLKDFARWDYISPEDWTELCQRSSDFAGVRDGDRLFEAGCGSGAFLAEVLAYRKVSLAGVDFAENLVEIARARLSGDFSVADITNLSAIQTGSYDRVLSHGVFLYLDTEDAARKAALEMVRVAAPGGTIYIGIVNDPERHADVEHPPSGTFLLRRSFWHDFAGTHGLSIVIVDQDQIFQKPTGYDAYSRMRYSLRLGKP